MSDDDDAVLDAIMALVPALLNALEALAAVARHLHPPQLAALVEAVDGHDAPMRDALASFRAVAWPEHLARFRETVEGASDSAALAFDGLRAAAGGPDGTIQAHRALRHAQRAVEQLYPVAALLPAVSRFYLEPARRGDQALLDRLAQAERSRQGVGVMHASNEREMRGGFSLYVPEYYDPARAWPLVAALHGGSGHGRLFLWTWLREARSRGLILLAPTAAGGTWSLTEPEVDGDSLGRMLAYVRETWSVDASRLLLTGMSDGGTFSLVSGLGEGSPFTHLAPIAASFHPFLLEIAEPARIQGLPIYLVHGALDWMFNVGIARTADRALSAAGARVTYREIADLSHTYPREENGSILDWFLGD